MVVAPPDWAGAQKFSLPLEKWTAGAQYGQHHFYFTADAELPLHYRLTDTTLTPRKLPRYHF